MGLWSVVNLFLLNVFTMHECNGLNCSEFKETLGSGKYASICSYIEIWCAHRASLTIDEIK